MTEREAAVGAAELSHKTVRSKVRDGGKLEGEGSLLFVNDRARKRSRRGMAAIITSLILRGQNR